ncbi:MAG: DUF2460 domain-containing protein [Bdellovibrionales bacterium]
MSFDDVVLPLRVDYGSGGGPSFSTDVVVIDNGFERRNQNWAQARRVFDARTGVRSAADAAALLAFFHARAGRARGFRLRDWSDYSSAADGVSLPVFSDQVLGTGDGVATQFALRKTYASGAVAHRRILTKPVSGSVAVGVGGVQLTSGFSVDTGTGVVTFAAPPASGQSVTAGFLFDVPARFDTDQLALTVENYSAYTAAIPLVEVRA